MIVDDDYLNFCFEEGERFVQHPGKIRLFSKRLSSVLLPSGTVVVCDPLVFPETRPLDVSVPPGEYPVYVTIAEIGTDQRIAFARVEFVSRRPARWVHISQPDQDVASLKFDECFGYPVDSGTGCFMDPQSGSALVARMTDEEDYYEHIMAEMEKTYVETWDWASITPGPDHLNVVCFSSGYGDGLYPNFLGFDERNQPVCLVTDFEVFSGTSPSGA